MRNLDQVTFPNLTDFYNSSDSKDFFKSNFCPHLYPRGCLPLERTKGLVWFKQCLRNAFWKQTARVFLLVTGAESA